MTPQTAKALRALERTGAQLAPQGDRFAVLRGKDRRGRAIAWLETATVAALQEEGALAKAESGLTLTEAGRARLKRAFAEQMGQDGFQRQHGAWARRAVAKPDGEIGSVVMRQAAPALERLLRSGGRKGTMQFNRAEQVAARRFRLDWERGCVGQMRGVDFTAPPKSGAARGPGAAAEAAMAVGLDARRRLGRAVQELSALERTIAEALLLQDQSLEAAAAARGLARTAAKDVLKAALAKIARAYGAA